MMNTGSTTAIHRPEGSETAVNAALDFADCMKGCGELPARWCATPAPGDLLLGVGQGRAGHNRPVTCLTILAAEVRRQRTVIAEQNRRIDELRALAVVNKPLLAGPHKTPAPVMRGNRAHLRV